MMERAERTFSFAEFELDTGKRLLLKNGLPLALNPKAFDLLSVLVRNCGQLLSKNELLEKVWENQFVEENNLTVHISALRKILGEQKGAHQFIVTVPGTGYKFVAEIHPEENNSLVKADGAALQKQSSKTFGEDDRLIGRALEISEIKDLLRRQNKCLITLTGAGGSGKTKLAQTIIDECRTEFVDGVFFIELAAVSQAERVIDTIAQALDVKESSARSLLDALKDFLRERSLLLVLDNFEHLLSAAPFLGALLDSAANLKILVTSRASLRLKIEHEKMVLPLAVPPPDANLTAEQLSAYSSVELFAVRAQSARPNFALSAENAPAVAKICHKLDGLPLAIELAAARVKLLSPQAILARLENSLKLLTGGANDLHERQRTMRATIGWSYDLLDEDERKLFRRLSIFAGGFTVEAAEAVCGEFEPESRTSFNSPPEILDLLSSLIDNNLLVSKEQPEGAVRLRMLEVVREFALECLETNGESEILAQNHARFFLALAEEAEPNLTGEKSIKWLDKLEIEHENIRAVLAWSLKNDGGIVARIAAALRYFWFNHSHFSEGQSWIRAALQVTGNTISEARFKLLLSNGIFLKKLGEFEAARKVCEQALAESMETNNLLQMIKAYHGLTALAVLQKDYASAKSYTEEILAVNRELNDEILTANTLCSLGDLEMSIGNHLAARPLFEESLSLSKKLGGKRLLSIIYFNLGTIDYLDNETDAAGFNFTESLRIALEMGNKLLISCAFDGFAAIAAKNGNAEQSAKLAGAAETLRESIGYKIEPAEERFRSDYLAKIRAALDEKTFTALYERGKTMNLDEAIVLAKVFVTRSSGGFFAQENEIIIEDHSFSQIIIEEEFED